MKLANILLDKHFQFKLADFGFSSLLEGERGQDKLYTIVGTRGFMAPELIDETPYNGAVVDLFAASVILFMMRSQMPPWLEADSKRDKHYRRFLKNSDEFWKYNASF